MANSERPSILATTKAQYEKITKRLSVMWKKEVDIIDNDIGIFPKPVEFCEWFSSGVANSRWSKSTFWLYRQSLMHYFEDHGPKEAIRLLSGIIPPPSKLADKKTSARKLKGLSGDKFEQLLSKLETYHEATSQIGKYDHFIASWLRVTVKAGLRPIEWRNAFFDEQTHTLIVCNAKVNENRGNGEVRHLVFDPETQFQEIEEIQNLLQKFSLYLKDTNGSFFLLYDKCRKRLCYVTKKLWPKMKERPTIYSARHQFAANMKKSGLSKKEVAALMGHKSDASAGIHYAYKSKGEIVNPPTSPANEIQSVLEKDVNFWQTVAKQGQTDAKDCKE